MFMFVSYYYALELEIQCKVRDMCTGFSGIVQLMREVQTETMI